MSVPREYLECPSFSLTNRPTAVCARRSSRFPHGSQEREMETTDIDARRLKLRAVTNQALFREVNEQIEGIAKTMDGTGRLVFVCECAHNDCVERIEMTHSEYETLRRIPTHFAVKQGHELAGGEEIIDRNDRYMVVAKIGVAGQTAMKLDRRKRNRAASGR
jgi:hypothetical protein